MKSTARSKTNAEWSELTQAALLGAAREMFAKYGYEQASLDTIAAAASVTKGSIYHHYGDKRGLFRAVVEDVQREIVAHVDQIAKGSPTYFEGILKGCEAFLEIVLKEGVARIVLTDAPSVLGWTVWRAIDNEIGGRSLRTGLEAAMRAGEIVRIDAGALTTFISGALNETALSIAESRNPKRTRSIAVATLRRVLENLHQTAAG
ncbi:MAG: TetR/AcrR family transcriptional regulator [Alphaproteobacteria bacterium]|nr:TetR/AcrR family transcriptional regulator [Alphaproteobacteria bacterium]